MAIVHESDHHQHEAGDEDAPDAVGEFSEECAVVKEGLADSNTARIADRSSATSAWTKRYRGSTPWGSWTDYAGYQAGIEGVMVGLHRISGLVAERGSGSG